MTSSARPFVWYELMTSDMDAAERFYRSVVGWDAQAWGGPDARYTILNAGGKPAAGLMTIPEEARQGGARPAWIGYIYAPDVDAATERLRAAGGHVHRAPADIPEVGRFAVVSDPQGAMFMLFAPSGGDNAPTPPMTPGHVGWHELYAADGPSAFDFYAAQFGWTVDHDMDMGPMGVYRLFATGGLATGGMMTKPPEVPVPMWLFYFVVPALDAASARVTEGGGQIINGPMEVPGGAWIVQCLDPQGAMFALVAAVR
jgi:predicted enzyme related to lactoylglutathione lyase